MKLLNKYDKTCEVALSAFACDVERVKNLLTMYHEGNPAIIITIIIIIIINYFLKPCRP